MHQKLSPRCWHHKLDEDPDGWVNVLSSEDAKAIFNAPEKKAITFAITSWILIKKRTALGKLKFILIPASDNGSYLGLQCLCGCGRQFRRWNGRLCTARMLHNLEDDDETQSDSSFCWSSSEE